jgi:STE24 endopeptidase
MQTDPAVLFTLLFVILLAVMVGLRLWLSARQVAHVASRRDHVPPAFANRIPLTAHQKAADYTIAKQKLARAEMLTDVPVLLFWTLGGGIAWVAHASNAAAAPWNDVLLLVAIMAISGIVGLPFSWYRTFVLEERFGFNRTTWAVWLGDMAKGIAVAAVLGIPLLLAVLWLKQHAGAGWWVYAWVLWTVFQLLMLVLFPTFIAPLFNKFSPLPAGDKRERIEGLLARCGFRVSGLFVMDGSKRSAHGNAYFTGFGRAKRIVFFDTLLERLAPPEIESVLAHELGHFALRHIVKMLLWSVVLSLGFFALLGWLAGSPWFYAGLGVGDPALATRGGVTLALFVLALPVFTFLLSPLASLYSRRHEFEADAFAAEHASASALIAALVKMYEDDAATLTPDPLHSAFYDSHPPAALRIARLAQAGGLPPRAAPA